MRITFLTFAHCDEVVEVKRVVSLANDALLGEGEGEGWWENPCKKLGEQRLEELD